MFTIAAIRNPLADLITMVITGFPVFGLMTVVAVGMWAFNLPGRFWWQAGPRLPKVRVAGLVCAATAWGLTALVVLEALTAKEDAMGRMLGGVVVRAITALGRRPIDLEDLLEDFWYRLGIWPLVMESAWVMWSFALRHRYGPHSFVLQLAVDPKFGCGTCGYSRSGLTPTMPCPECGQRPLDLGSMTRVAAIKSPAGHSPGFWALFLRRRRVRPIGFVLASIAARMLGSVDDLSILGEWGLAVLECFLLGRGLMLALVQCGGSASWGRVLAVLPATALIARCIVVVIGGGTPRLKLVPSGLLGDPWVIFMWLIAVVLFVLPARHPNRGVFDGGHAPY